MISRRAYALLSLLALGTTGCGKEMGRVRFAKEGTDSTPMTLAAGQVSFWTDLDIEYTGDAALAYTVELSQGGAVVARTTCHPLGHLSVKIGYAERNWGGKRSRSGSGKMGCTATLVTGGPTDVQATLTFGKLPTTLRLGRADLVVKQ